MKHGKLFLIMLACMAIDLSGTALSAGNLRVISSREGLSNNSILCLSQDTDGYIWLGTCEGLNFWDGQDMVCYPQENSGAEPLSGNLIERIHATRDSYSWVRTNYGLDLMHRTRVIEQHKEFQGIYFLISRSKSQTIVLTQSGNFYGYCERDASFRQIPQPEHCSFESYITSWTGESDSLFLFMTDGIYRAAFADSRPEEPCGLERIDKMLPMELSYVFADKEIVLLIDAKGILYTFDPSTEVLEYIADIHPEIRRYGKVSYAIKNGNDFLVSFLFDGVTKLSYTPENAQKYVAERLDINCGVFSLLRDANQDIVWIGSDGQGLFMYANDEVSFHSYTYDKLPYNLSKPVRSLLLDSRGTLWFATKGEGIIRIPSFSASSGIKNVVQINGPGSGLANNAVFALEESSRGLVWIGSEGAGINYKSFSDPKIRTLGGDVPRDLKYIHAIHESSRDTLWVATVGCGVFRLLIGDRGGTPYIREWKKLDFGKEMENKDFFFTLYEDADKTLWIGNRGGGLVHYFPQDDTCTITTFDDSRAEIANDVWAIHRAKDGRLWIGTSWGLLLLEDDGTVRETPIRNIIHGILEDSEGKLYLSTNSGLVRYDPLTTYHARYGYSYGINTIEYSDGAAFRDAAGNALFFGGTNGFVVMEQTRYKAEPFYPDLLFRSVQINGRQIAFEDAVREDSTLVVRPHERLYGISAIALDYINGSNYIYLYNVEGTENRWIESSSDIQFAERHPGKYTLHVKYKNIITGDTSPVRSLRIIIKAPWYAGTIAKCVYTLLFLLFAALAGLYVHRRRTQKKMAIMEKIEAKRKEETLDSKLHLMENLAQQMAIPVFMVSVPCQQILEYHKSDDYIRTQLKKILQQSSKLGHIIRMLHNFRESNESNNLNVKIFSVTDYMTEIGKSYLSLARDKNIDLRIDVPQGLLWTSDPKRVSAVMDMTITNAFLHVAKRGKIAFDVRSERDRLVITTEVEGKWISEAGFRRLTDKYAMMEDFQKRGERGESFQDEMRLVVCHNYVKGLGGTMEFRRTDRTFRFEIRLPSLDISGSGAETGEDIIDSFAEEYRLSSHIMMIEKDGIRQFDTAADRQTMFIIGSETGIINSVAEMFSEEYNVRTFTKPAKFTEEMQNGHPDIIVCENIPMKTETETLMMSVKNDRVTVKIPIVLITSLQNAESLTVEYADSILSLPVDVKVLKSTVKQNLNRVSSLREYYNSSLSVYEFTDGKMLHSEDKKFLEKLLKTINDNISDSEITTETIARKMGISLRNLYSRINGIVNITPSNIIREYRLTYAEHLLMKTKLSVDEIIYKSGFANRGTFFRNFSAKYGCTPKNYRKRNIGDFEPEATEDTENLPGLGA